MAAENGVITMVGVNSKRTYTISLYDPGSVGNALTFNPSGAAVAGSQAFYIIPEDVVITQFRIATGTTSTGATLLSNGAPFNGNVIQYALNLLTVTTPQALNIGMKAGTQLSATAF